MVDVRNHLLNFSGIQQAPGIGRAIMECIVYGGYQTINLERFGFERILGKAPLYESNIV